MGLRFNIISHHNLKIVLMNFYCFSFSWTFVIFCDNVTFTRLIRSNVFRTNKCLFSVSKSIYFLSSIFSHFLHKHFLNSLLLKIIGSKPKVLILGTELLAWNSSPDLGQRHRGVTPNRKYNSIIFVFWALVVNFEAQHFRTKNVFRRQKISPD